MKRQELMWIFVCFALSLFTADVWASSVPDTGQTKCYNATVEIPCPSSGQPFYGQDAQYTSNPMSYTKLDGSGNALLDSAASWVRSCPEISCTFIGYLLFNSNGC